MRPNGLALRRKAALLLALAFAPLLASPTFAAVTISGHVVMARPSHRRR
jgi:hypothetical protein